MTTAAVESPPFARLWVPMLPAEPSRASKVASERHGRWLWGVATFRDAARAAGTFGRVTVPFRVVATVRIADARRHTIAEPPLDRWRVAVERAITRTLTSDPSRLRGVEVQYRAIDGVPMLDQPLRTGTEFLFFAEDDR
jgi:hypothetical protein